MPELNDITIPSNFLTHSDTKCVLEAIRLLKKEYGDEVAIIGKTMGPWSLGYHCFGVEPFLLMSFDDPGKTHLALDRMGFIAETGCAAFHYDSKNKPLESMEAVEGKISLVGNINNPETLFARGPEEITKEVFGNLEHGIHMVGPECAIPLQTSIENLKAIPAAVKDWHRSGSI